MGANNGNCCNNLSCLTMSVDYKFDIIQVDEKINVDVILKGNLENEKDTTIIKNVKLNVKLRNFIDDINNILVNINLLDEDKINEFISSIKYILDENLPEITEKENHNSFRNIKYQNDNIKKDIISSYNLFKLIYKKNTIGVENINFFMVSIKKLLADFKMLKREDFFSFLKEIYNLNQNTCSKNPNSNNNKKNDGKNGGLDRSSQNVRTSNNLNQKEIFCSVLNDMSHLFSKYQSTIDAIRKSENDDDIKQSTVNENIQTQNNSFSPGNS